MMEAKNINLAEIASIIAEPSRASILVALLDGRMHPASELAYMAKIKPQTASFHLAKLLSSSIILMEKQGRHRYFRLNPGAAGLLETLMSIAPLTPVKSLKEFTQAKAIKQARTCYDHFAGEFGVALTDSMVKSGYLLEHEEDYQITQQGLQLFNDFGIDLAGLRMLRRSFAKKCIDWSERKFHLAGALGYGIVSRFQELNWVEPITGSRAIRITTAGKAGVSDWFNLRFDR
jgi:DNA-binding transcriptional ArsR family regulator